MHPVHFLGELSVVEHPYVILEQRTHGVVGRAVVESLVSKEVFEGSDEGGLGWDEGVRVGMGGGGCSGVRGRKEEEEERKKDE